MTPRFLAQVTGAIKNLGKCCSVKKRPAAPSSVSPPPLGPLPHGLGDTPVSQGRGKK